MASSSRSFRQSGQIPDKREKLTLDEAWTEVKSKICEDIFRREVNVIPTLTDASQFDLFAIAIKKNSPGFGTLFGRPSTYQILGHVADLANLEKTDVDRLLESCNTLAEQTDYQTNFQYEGKVEKNDGVFSVRIDFSSVHKAVLNITLEKGDLFLKNDIPPLKDSKSVYLITEVIYADRIRTCIATSSLKEKFSVEGVTPIGFTFMKFGLAADGLVAEPKKNKIHADATFEVLTEEMAKYANFPKGQKAQ